jgi:hypothetical protein
MFVTISEEISGLAGFHCHQAEAPAGSHRCVGIPRTQFDILPIERPQEESNRSMNDRKWPLLAAPNLRKLSGGTAISRSRESLI